LKSMQHRLGVRGRSYPVRWQAPTDIEADRADLTALRTGKFTE